MATRKRQRGTEIMRISMGDNHFSAEPPPAGTKKARADVRNALRMTAFPPEIRREILMRLDAWADVVRAMVASQCFRDLLSPADGWTRKYAPSTPFDLTQSDEPVEAFRVVSARWRDRTRGLNFDGLLRLAAAGRTSALLWLDARLQAKSIRVGKGQASRHHAQKNAKRMNARQIEVTEKAAREGHVDIVMCLVKRYPSLVAQGKRIMRAAARGGHVALIDVLHHIASTILPDGADNHDADTHRWCRDGTVTNAATYAGAVEVLDRLVSIGCPAALVPSKSTLDAAISTGKIDMVRWVINHPAVLAQPDALRRCSREHVDLVASGGNLDIVMLLHTEGIKHCRVSTLVAGVKSKSPRVLPFIQWAITPDVHGCCPLPEWCDSLVAVRAAEMGHLDVIQWLHKHHPDSVTIEAARAAAKYCRHDVVVYLDRVGVAPLTSYNALRHAARCLYNSRKDEAATTKHVSAIDAIAAAGAPYDAEALRSLMRAKCIPAIVIIARRYCAVPPCAAPTAGDKKTALTADDMMCEAAAVYQLDTIRWVRDNIAGARLCVAIDAMRSRGGSGNCIAALGRCRCPVCAKNA